MTKKYTFLILIILTLKSISLFAAEYNGFYIYPFFSTSLAEERNNLDTEIKFDKFDYIFSSPVRLGIGIDSSIPYVDFIFARFEMSALISYNNTKYEHFESVTNLNPGEDGADPEVKVTTNIIYPIKDSGMDFEIGLFYHRFSEKRFEPFFGLTARYSFLSYTKDINRTVSEIIDGEQSDDFVKDIIHGFGFGLAGGTYIKIWSAFSVKVEVGMNLQNYANGSFDRDGSRIIQSTTDEDVFLTKREYLLKIGFAMKLPYKFNDSLY